MNLDRRYKIGYLMHGARNVGGGEYSIYYLIKNLRRSLFTPVVIYTHENEIIRKIQLAGIRNVRVLLHENITSVYREEIKYDPISLTNYVWHLLNGIYSVISILKAENVVLLHPHDNLSKVIGGIAAKILGIKVVVHCRDALKNDMLGHMLKLLYIHFTDRIIPVSKKTASFFQRRNGDLPKKIHIIYNGVDIHVFHPEKDGEFIRKKLGIKPDDTVLGIIGVLEKYKGHIYLFQAIEKLKALGMENLKCLVIGNG